MTAPAFAFDSNLARAATIPANWYFTDPGTPETWNTLQDSIAFSDQVQKEDIQLCEDVWRNLQSGVYTQGRYSAKRENGVHHFHGLLAEYLSI